MKDTVELKPCPFCGSVSVILKTFVIGENKWFYVTCCACKAEINNPMPIAEEAIKRWNRRVNDG